MTGFEFDSTPGHGTNRAAKPTRCATCEGDRFVVVRLRSPEQTIWMTEHGIKASTTSFNEEVAPCPDCNRSVDVDYFRYDGSKFRGMDPATVRESLNR